MDFLRDYTNKINKALDNIELPEDPNNLYDPLRYFFRLGGKRIRPILTLLAAERFDKSGIEDPLQAALAVEIFHNFSLIHDDIMDEAPVRRGQQTVHKKWDQNIAILSGDVMLVKAYQYLNTYSPEIANQLIQVFNKTAIEVCEGQQMDMDFEKISNVTKEEYIRMITLKTSVLLGCALQMGAIIGGANSDEQTDLYAYGMNMGIAFQIQDDLLDLYGDPELVGKQVGGDIIANKNTLLMVVAKEAANEKQMSTLDKLSNEPNIAKKIEGIIALFKTLKVQENCLELMSDFYEKAEYHLNKIGLNSSESALYLLTKELKKRSY